MLQPIKNTKIYTNIVEQIKKMIVDGELTPGERLPSERELAESLTVSRTSVREALRILESMDLIECRSGDGNFVAEVTMDSLAKSIAWRIPLIRGTVTELFEVRKIIEPGIVRIAAERANDEDIKKMQKILNKQKKLVEKGKSIFDLDNEFHYAIAEASKNTVIMKMIDMIITLQKETKGSKIEVGERPRHSLQSHSNIFSYLKIKDKERARKAMLTHLTTVEKLIVEKLEAV